MIEPKSQKAAWTKRTFVFYTVISFVLGVLICFLGGKVGFFQEKKCPVVSLERLPANNNYLTRPLLGIEIAQNGSAQLEPMKQRITQLIDNRMQKGDVLGVAVYVRDLNKGIWVGVNEDEKFDAASLFKVPLMIAYLKLAQRDPTLLKREIVYDADVETMSQNIAPARSLQLGQAYTIEELLRHMIVYSDNISYAILYKNLKDMSFLTTIFSDLELPGLLHPQGGEYKISAREFLVFFRVLYNVTYLDRFMSEKALLLLSETDFHGGIDTGIEDKNILVAHKFAERKFEGMGGMFEFHDCGIVYAPHRPYAICVMTRGLDKDVLRNVVSELSKIVYDGMTQGEL